MKKTAAHVMFTASVPGPEGGAYITELHERTLGELSIEVDYAYRVVRVGYAEYPFENIGRIFCKPPELECPECKKLLFTPNGLGAHRWHEHGVKGERSK